LKALCKAFPVILFLVREGFILDTIIHSRRRKEENRLFYLRFNRSWLARRRMDSLSIPWKWVLRFRDQRITNSISFPSHNRLPIVCLLRSKRPLPLSAHLSGLVKKTFNLMHATGRGLLLYYWLDMQAEDGPLLISTCQFPVSEWGELPCLVRSIPPCLTPSERMVHNTIL